MTQETKHKVSAILLSPRTLLGLWIVLAVVSALTKMSPERCNNFLIFKGVFWHTFYQTSLYQSYPQEYFDVNHYGPLFSLVIAPFAVIPHLMGLVFWQILLTISLFVAMRRLPIGEKSQVFILWFCTHELLTALFMQQFNIAIATIVIGTYILIRNERDTTAALLIAIGTFVKIYGVVGLAFFFFSRHKCRFIVSLVGWGIVLFVLPMLISSPEYIMGQYKEWFVCLVEKNGENAISIAQNISLLGMAHRITGWQFSDLLIIIPGIILFALPYLRFSQYRNTAYQMNILASVLMFVCLFSTGTESSGYIIALTGVAIWYVASPWHRSYCDIALMVFAFILTSLSPSDLFPAYIREHFVQPYSLKALPVAIIWFKLCYEMMVKDYTPLPIQHEMKYIHENPLKR